MLIATVLTALLQQSGAASCALAEAEVSTGWTASAVIQELADQKGVAENQVGAVAFLWREEACQLLTEDADLLHQTKKAIEDECQKILYLPEAAESTYVASLESAIRQRSPTLVTLAWAQQNERGEPQHTFIVSDGAAAVRVVSAGYGRGNKLSRSCEPSPWSLAAGLEP